MNIILLLAGVLVGFFLAKTISGTSEGDRPERSLRIPVRGYYIHIHHWLFSLIIVALLYPFEIYHPLVYGFFIGVIVQGLTYKDRFNFFYRRKVARDK